MKLWHAVSGYNGDSNEEFERKWLARQSWDELYKQGVLPCVCWTTKRTARDIGDKRELPYFRDVLEFAIRQAKDDDIIFYTNDDNWLHPQLGRILGHHCGRYDACTSHREGTHIGRDLFAAKKQWWRDNWDDIPDAIIGCSEYDLHLACVIRLKKGIRSTVENLKRPIIPAEIQRGYVKHVDHKAEWTKMENLHSPAQMHNRKLFFDWCKVNLPELPFNERMQLCAH